MSDDSQRGIWLEVSEARFEGGDPGKCEVLLKADRSYPRPIWWPVSVKALAPDKVGFDAYKAIVAEIDKKRLVLAQLGCKALLPTEPHGGTAEPSGGPHDLQCIALRFQTPELGSR